MTGSGAFSAIILAAFAGACGGTTVASKHGPPLVDGGTSSTEISDPCESNLAPPTFSIEPGCTGFIPTILVIFHMQLVERTTIRQGANHWLEHRFRSDPTAYQCGFDVLLRMDRLTFGTIGDRFDGSVWWIQGLEPLNTLALVLRSGDRIRLAVATAGNSSTLVTLNPYEVSLRQGVCGTDPVVKVALLENGAPVPCEPDPDDKVFERCNAGLDVFRTVPYFVPRSPDPPTIIADAALLSSAK